jgi:TolB-like protein/DNA-binding winged helix-turn-helix (wHTH) protein/Flp pilus assembly protein TadD
MAIPAQTGKVIRFGAFELDSRLGELRKNGSKLRLQGQPLQVLEILVEQAGDLVSRDTLRERLWPADTFVDFDHSLNNAVARIREALGDSAEQPSFIQTIPRRGYLFLKSVECVGPSAQTPAQVAPPIAGPAVNAGDQRASHALILKLVKISAGGALVVLALTGIARWVKATRSTPLQVHSIAVLPFTNLSGDPNQEYFADGMTEELVTELGKVGALRVISHTSVNRFKGTKAPVQEIARDLQVDALVEGIVAREGNRVRVTANLVQAFPEKHLWAQSYDRDLRNVLDLQSEIARTVADQIKIAITPDERLRLTTAQPVDPESHELLLKGSFYIDKWTEAGFQKAIAYFNASLQKDPRNARAYAGLALAYAGVGISDPTAFPKEKAAALKALAIDDTLADAHNGLAWAEFTYDWDTVKAESEFHRAIELNPNDSRAHAYYGVFLAMLGRVDDSLREVQRTRELDPLSLAKTALAWRTYYSARDYDKAIQALQNAADMDPNFVSAYRRMIPIYEQKGELDQAIQVREQAAAFDKQNAKELKRHSTLLRKAYNAGGARGYWVQKLEFVKTKTDNTASGNMCCDDPGDPIALAAIYTRLGNKDEALRWLQKAFSDHIPYLIWVLPASPDFDALRSDPQYAELLRNLAPHGAMLPPASTSWRNPSRRRGARPPSAASSSSSWSKMP